MIDIKSKDECCGCEACAQICPVQCIEMCADSEGFLYPVVDKEKCIQCGLCERTCPVINSKEIDDSQLLAYAAVNLNELILEESSSGGAFSVLAEYVLNEGGIVYGASFDEKVRVKHIGVDNLSELSKLRGSKYVQSFIGDCFIEVKKQVESGRLVLFTGTPCHVAALQLFLRKGYNNLLTMDFICHGVPSPLIWSEYLKELHYDVNDVSFRDKTKGWNNFALRIQDKKCSNSNKKMEDGYHEHYALLPLSFKQNHYMNLFLKNVILRPSCYNCKSKRYSSNSTVKVADFWGVQENYPELMNKKGVTLLLTNDIDQKLMDVFSSKMKVSQIDLVTALSGNSAYYNSVSPHKKRDKFFTKFNTGSSVVKLSTKILKRSLFTKVLDKIKNKLK